MVVLSLSINRMGWGRKELFPHDSGVVHVVPIRLQPGSWQLAAVKGKDGVCWTRKMLA